MPPLLSVVVPVFNGGPEILDNIETIRMAVTEPLGADAVEVIVVSDGSIDGTAERLQTLSREAVRVIHYDRNLGKGYAVKAGILAAEGAWIGICDADLDLDPRALTHYLDVAQRDDLDLAIGSKRHPESVVEYPRSRRIGSWAYQQLVRVLFGLSVRDTQVGLKLMSRRVADDVVPLLLVKQFAFDLELLAVAHALGRDRIRELPIRLDYQFSGSGVRSRAVFLALLDTAAVFYRLRILRTYQRRRAFTVRAAGPLPEIAVVHPPGVELQQDYPVAEVVSRVADATASVVAILDAGARPAGNWLSAAAPLLADPAVIAVVCPTLAPLDGPFSERVAAGVLESRLGGGARRDAYLPGNVGTVTDFPAGPIVVRRDALDRVDDPPLDALVSRLAELGDVVYTPETMVVSAPPPAVRPLLASLWRTGIHRGRLARSSRGRSLTAGTALSFAPTVCALVGLPLALRGGNSAMLGVVLLGLATLLVLAAAARCALQFRSLLVGAAVAPLAITGQLAYAGGFVRGLLTRGIAVAG